MGNIADVFSKEDRVEVKISQFTEMLKGSCEKEILMNAISCEVPYRYIREMVTGKSEKMKEENMDGVIAAEQEEKNNEKEY